ncbi:hypothetical protein BW723_11915 [Polaribacter reichenbachii]|uniref:DoxX family protein n=1 Tax=Polaribacter reichenbachii TaxID=996801 RepID=A0A1B8TPY1_9FLAO|nr:hypothetical protein [Polaribacter reichenbachii]APZ46946.1 hypothetical protein BW723_11915 [Polaribacter reichenbachii]AUC17589.1 hypothetical protein BTO17_02365 [Polaribacter reichenbachii]OBY61538.1 hypothetical protein LPB301_15860 [Polaribacter reichenbachii]
MKQKTFPQLFVIYLRYLIGFAFIFASLVKIQGLRFTAESGAENPINSAWHFFETLYQSGLYWHFIGIAQCIAGTLLITQRFAKLGAIIFLPIIANVFVITISYDFRGTPIITGLMLLSSLFLIYWDWDSLKILINKKPTNSNIKRLENDKLWVTLGISLAIITIITKVFIFNRYISFAFLLMTIIGLVGLIVGYRKRKLYQ